MDRNMRNQHPMMSNMQKRHVSSHHQQQSHHQQHSQSHSMMGQGGRDREQIQSMHQHHYHQPQQHQPQPHHQQQQQQQHHHHHQQQQHSAAGLQQNEDLIKYIEDAWHKVQSSVNKVTSDHGPHSGAKYYKNSAEPPANFEPFDLESYWGRRMVQNIHLSRNHQ